MSGAVDILGLTAAEAIARAKELLPSGAGLARKLYGEALTEGRFEPESHGLNAASVAGWRAHFRLGLLEVARRFDEPSELGPSTVKAVLRTHDGLEIETVLIPMAKGRHTLCVSSQVGCKLACGFCETGRMGLLRDLTAAEIVAQVVVARSVLGWPVRNVVFMGMGEPLDNPDQLLQALRVLNDDRGLQLGQSRLTVCTSGVPGGFERLATLGWRRLDVSISLNAAFDDKRDRIMPINRRLPLAELQRALIAYPRREKFVYGVNYCLLPGLNDAREDAEAVVEFVRPLGRVMLNVIPYNPGTRPLTRAPEDDEVRRFIGWLAELGVPVTRRVTKGRSVMAACGQLGNLELRRRRPLTVVEG